jgi:steroid delta-isomerase-like uncharacterized protein
MTREDVLAVVTRRLEALSRRDWAAFADTYAADARVESPLAGSCQGQDAIVRATQAFIGAFPDATFENLMTVVDGDRAVTILEVTGTQSGGIMGLPPSGRPFRFIGANAFIVADDRIVYERRIYDFTGLLVQVGVLKAKPV